MDFKVDIDPEQINKEVSEAILKSAIGKQLKESIEKEVKNLGGLYNNPMDTVIRGEVNKVIKELIAEKYQDQIRAEVEKHITDKVVSDITGKAWEAFIGSI